MGMRGKRGFKEDRETILRAVLPGEPADRSFVGISITSAEVPLSQCLSPLPSCMEAVCFFWGTIAESRLEMKGNAS